MQAATVPGPGDVLLGRFRVEAEIGRGGMGVVLRATDSANKRFAVKVLLPEAVESPEALPRFIAEASATRELTSEHVVRVYETGTLESGLPFMVMELLEGNDLGSLVEQHGPMTIPEACDAVIEACAGLADAHARGMVHRDLKPSNLFAANGPDGRRRVKVLDFGVSKIAASIRQAALTSTGTILGSPHYMAPEQLKSARGADARADIWSLGVVLYELLSGKIPFNGRSFGQLFMEIVSEDAPTLATVRPNTPPALSEVVSRCMKRNRDERYQDLGALVSALAPFGSAAGSAAAARIAAAAPAFRAPSESRQSFPDLGPTPFAPPVQPAQLAQPAQPAALPRSSQSKLGGTMLMSNAPSSARMLAAPPAAAAPQAPYAQSSGRLPVAAPAQSSNHMLAAPPYGGGQAPSGGHSIAQHGHNMPVAVGQSVAQQPQPMPVPPAAPVRTGGPKLAIIIGIMIALLLVGAVLIVLAMRFAK